MPEAPGPTDAADVEPGVHEVYQETTNLPAVEVVVVNAPRVRPLPARSGGLTSIMVGLAASGGVKVLGADPRRKTAQIIGLASDLRLGRSQGEVLSNEAAVWPANVPYVDETCDDLWAVAVTVATQVTIAAEHWVD